ncbi:hypothetical protein, partial [Sporotomaculum syntrophicum]|uniref:hypothetical protein n=1 Tax=Sporotomaculum syntrophicum TaxID=182264 RepID=UPI00137A4F32
MEILICSITTHQTTLPGRNGLDLNISRLYQSNQALWGDLRTSGDRGGYSDYATYYQNRYNLGLGWSFCFPSVQVEKIGYESNGRIYFKKELYYHTGDGRVYHVDSSSSSGGTYSTLEKYYDKDAK